MLSLIYLSNDPPTLFEKRPAIVVFYNQYPCTNNHNTHLLLLETRRRSHISGHDILSFHSERLYNEMDSRTANGPTLDEFTTAVMTIGRL